MQGKYSIIFFYWIIVALEYVTPKLDCINCSLYSYLFLYHILNIFMILHGQCNQMKVIHVFLAFYFLFHLFLGVKSLLVMTSIFYCKNFFNENC